MTDTKHTPGPWLTEVSDRYLKSGTKGVEYWVRAPDVRIICSRIDTEADARLIAAAPELLAALEEVLADSEAQDPHFGGLSASVIERARNAVALARGDK